MKIKGCFGHNTHQAKFQSQKDNKKCLNCSTSTAQKNYFYAFQGQWCIIILKTMESQQQNHQILVKVQEKVQNTLSENRHPLKVNLNTSKQSNHYLIDRKTCNKNQSPEKNCALRDLDKWEPAQIQQLFKFYDQHGPQWKNMSLAMPFRTANNLKNKFYTVLRNLIKTIFRRNANLCPKMTGEISSRDLCRLYDGREDYQIYANFIRQLLQEIDYDLERSEQLDGLLGSRTQFIKGIYQTIYKEKLAELQFSRFAGGSEHSLNSHSGKIGEGLEMREQTVIYGNQSESQFRNGSFFSGEGAYIFYLIPQPTYIWSQNFY